MVKDKLTELMLERNINKAQLAKGAEIPYTTIDGLLKKDSENVKLQTLKKIAKYFDCTIDYLVNDEPNDKRDVVHSNIFNGLDTNEIEMIIEIINVIKRHKE